MPGGTPPSVAKSEICNSLKPYLLERELRHHNRDRTFKGLQHGVACEPVQSPVELSSDAHLRARGLFQLIAHEVLSEQPTPGLPWRRVDTGQYRVTAAPLLGQPSDEVFAAEARPWGGRVLPKWPHYSNARREASRPTRRHLGRF